MKDISAKIQTFGIFVPHNGRLERVDTWHDITGRATEESIRKHLLEDSPAYSYKSFTVKKDEEHKEYYRRSPMPFTFW